MIALIHDKDGGALAALLSPLDEVTLFPDGVALAYYLQHGNPCALAVIAVDGAEGMNYCSFARGQRGTVPILWITEQAEFENQSKRIPVNGFLLKPVADKELLTRAKQLLNKENGGIL